VPIEITSDAFERAMDRIAALDDPQVFARVTFDAARAAGVKAESLAKDYPRPRNTTMQAVRGVTFLTDKQRRFFFAALRDGRIKVPYRRTGQLGNSITSAPFQEAGKVGFFVGTNLDYAQWVIGKRDDQAAYHRDWWTPFDERFTPEAIKEIGDVFAAAALVSIRRWLKSGN
jgi:hypothetical protein